MTDDAWAMSRIMAAILPDQAVDWSSEQCIRFWVNYRFNAVDLNNHQYEAIRIFHNRLMARNKPWENVESD